MPRVAITHLMVATWLAQPVIHHALKAAHSSPPAQRQRCRRCSARLHGLCKERYQDFPDRSGNFEGLP
jgi:hypothetical protein